MKIREYADQFKKAAAASMKRFTAIIRLRLAPVLPERKASLRAEKAVTASVKHFYRMVDPVGVEMLGLKASVMAQKLVKDGVIDAANKMRADEIIHQILRDRHKMPGFDSAVVRMEYQVAQALLAARLIIDRP